MTWREPEAGVSLVETLVVLAIVGIMSGLTLLGLGTLDRGTSGESEAARLANRLQFAVDEAIVTAVPLALVWDEHGYRFLAWDAAGARWQWSAHRDLGRRHSLPTTLRLAREGRDSGPVMISPDLPQPPAIVRVSGGGGTWRVDFDGLGAAVARN